jgi:hypothetical protein
MGLQLGHFLLVWPEGFSPSRSPVRQDLPCPLEASTSITQRRFACQRSEYSKSPPDLPRACR